jgi:hypothetical protein
MNIRQHTYSSLFALPLLGAGLALISLCVLLPQMQANRRLLSERDKLQGDLTYVQRQLTLNETFLKHVGGDPDLAERLAQRQMKQIRTGTSVLPLREIEAARGMSPFLLVSAGPPPTAQRYAAPGGIVGRLCRSPRRQLYLCGVGMLMVATGLVIGGSAPAPDDR